VVVDRRLSVDPSDLNASVGVVWTRFPGSGAKQCCHCELGGQLKRKKLESLATILPVDGLVPANTRGHDGGNVRFCAERGLLGTGPFGDWAFWGLGLLGTGPFGDWAFWGLGLLPRLGMLPGCGWPGDAVKEPPLVRDFPPDVWQRPRRDISMVLAAAICYLYSVLIHRRGS
jgi:hypothetical protein